MNKPLVAPPPCPKCQCPQTKVIGHSERPMLSYVQCDGCGHVFVPQDGKRS